MSRQPVIRIAALVVALVATTLLTAAPPAAAVDQPSPEEIVGSTEPVVNTVADRFHGASSVWATGRTSRRTCASPCSRSK